MAEVDNCLREYLAAVDDYTQTMTILHTAIKNGLFNIALARRQMGATSITATHCAGEMEASTRVDIDESGNFQHVAPHWQTNRKADDNPIKWFGLLIPKQLRQSQKDFLTGAEYATLAANAANKLKSSRTKYIQSLNKHKNQ